MLFARKNFLFTGGNFVSDKIKPYLLNGGFMDITQRLLWSTRSDGIAVFFEGAFARFYQAHLAWYCQRVKPIKVCTRELKQLGGLRIYYGAVPIKHFNTWLMMQDPNFFALTIHSWGVWMSVPEQIDSKALINWCERLVAERQTISTPPNPGVISTGLCLEKLR